MHQISYICLGATALSLNTHCRCCPCWSSILDSPAHLLSYTRPSAAALSLTSVIHERTRSDCTRLSVEDPAIVAITQIIGPIGTLLHPASESQQWSVVLSEIPREVKVYDAKTNSPVSSVILVEASLSSMAEKMTTTVRAEEKPLPLSGKALWMQLRSLDSSVEKKSPETTLSSSGRCAGSSQMENNQGKKKEFILLHRRVTYLAQQIKNEEQANGNGAHLPTVGHL